MKNNSSLIKQSEKYSFLCGLITMIIGFLCFVAWIVDKTELFAGSEKYIPMAPNTAFLFLVCGVSLVATIWDLKQQTRLRTLLSSSGLVFLISGLNIVEFLFKIKLNSNDWLIQTDGVLGGIPLGHMSPITSVGFFLLAGIFTGMAFNKKRIIFILNMILFLISLILLMGYIYRSPFLYGGALVPVALPTAFCFFVLSIGFTLRSGLEIWPISMMIGSNSRAILIRWLVPFFLFFFLIEDYIKFVLTGISDPRQVLITALSSICAMVLIPLIVHFVSRRIGTRLDLATKELRENRTLLQAIIDGTSDAIYVKDLNGRYLLFNRAVETFTGKVGREVIGKDDTFLFPVNDAKLVMDGDRQVMADHEVKTYEENVLTQSGIITTFLSTKGPIYDENNNVVGLFGIARDITERKQNEVRLRMINNCLSNLKNNFDVNISDLTELCGKVFGATCALYNRLENKECLHSIGKWNTPSDFETKDKPDGHICYDVIKEGSNNVLSIRDLDKTPYVLSDVNVAKYGLKTYIGHSVHCAGNAVGSLCAVFQKDIVLTDDDKILFSIIALSISREEERKQAERKLQETKDNLELIFNTSPEGAVITRLSDGLIIDANQSFSTITGFNRDDVVGKSSLEMNLWADPSDRKKIVDILSLNGFCNNYEALFKRKNGSQFFGSMSAKVIMLFNTPHIISMSHDITERKLAEKEKENLRAQLVHSSKLASIGTLAAGVAHEINNPLTIIRGYTDIVKDALKKRNILGIELEILDKQDRATERIANIVNNLRDFARTNDDAIENIDIHKAISDTQDLVNVMFVKESITIETDFQCQTPQVLADMGKFQQVIMNLLVNAKDAIKESGGVGVIKIVTTSNEKIINITISDNGSGMNETQKIHAFDAFYTTKAPGKGTGLGLSISHSIINSFGGTISVESQKNKGTTFSIKLPMARKDEVKKVSNNPSLKEWHKLKGTVYIIDDEEEIRRILRLYLEEFGLEVAEAKDGVEAFEKLKGTHFDFIISDIKMPNMSGDELLYEFKKLPQSANTQFIMITGGVITEYSKEQQQRLSQYADAYIQKPFTKEMIYNSLVSKTKRSLNYTNFSPVQF